MFRKKEVTTMEVSTVEISKVPLRTLDYSELQKLYESRNLFDISLNQYDLPEEWRQILNICKELESLGGVPFTIPANHYLYSIVGQWKTGSILRNNQFDTVINYGFPLPYNVICSIQKIVDKIPVVTNNGHASVFILSPSPYLGIQPDENQSSKIQQADPSLVVILNQKMYSTKNNIILAYRFNTWDLTLDGLHIQNI